MKGLIADKTRIIYILEAITEVEKYLRGVSYDDFLANSEKRFATIKQIEIVGEACNSLTHDFKDSHPQIAWKPIRGFRNISIHEYFAVNFHIVWEIAQNASTPGCSEGGGGAGNPEEPDYELAAAKTVDWAVFNDPTGGSGTVQSVDRLKGKRVSTEPQGGHFTGARHYESICNFCNIADPYNVWNEEYCSHSINSPQSITLSIGGNLQYNGLGYLVNNSKTYSFGSVFD